MITRNVVRCSFSNFRFPKSEQALDIITQVIYLLLQSLLSIERRQFPRVELNTL